MNVSSLFLHVFKPAEAARAVAEARITNVPGCERTPIAALLKNVDNAGTLRGDAFTCRAAQRLAAHVDGKSRLTPAQIINQVRAVKHEQQAVLRGLMQRSAGVRAGSDRARAIVATRAALESARQFNWDVRVVALPAPAGKA